MRRSDNKEDSHYERTSICADGFLAVSKSPQTIANALINKCNNKLKGTGTISHHLGCDFTQHGNKKLFLAPRESVCIMPNSHVSIFFSKPK